MSDNALVCVIVASCLAGCATCSVSGDIRKTRDTEIESIERLEILKATGKMEVKP